MKKLLSIALLLLITVFSFGCARAEEGKIKASGTIEAQETEITPEIAGKIVFLGATEGQKVKKGDILVKIDAKVLELQVQQAEANLDAAESRLAASVAQTRVALDLARAQLEKALIKAPFEGIIVSKNMQLYEITAPGRSVLTLQDPGDKWITVYIPETDVSKIEINQDAEIKIDGYPDKTFKGKVSRIADKAEFTPKNVQTKEERVTTVFAVKIAVSGGQPELKAGLPADVFIEAGR